MPPAVDRNLNLATRAVDYEELDPHWTRPRKARQLGACTAPVRARLVASGPTSEHDRECNSSDHDRDRDRGVDGRDRHPRPLSTQATDLLGLSNPPARD